VVRKRRKKGDFVNGFRKAVKVKKKYISVENKNKIFYKLLMIYKS